LGLVQILKSRDLKNPLQDFGGQFGGLWGECGVGSRLQTSAVTETMQAPPWFRLVVDN